MIEFSIPAVPPSLNDWSRAHWSRRSHMAKQWKSLVRLYAKRAMRRAGLRDPFSPAIVTLTFRLPNGGDAANREKHVTDGLIGVAIVDDAPRYLAELRLRSERGRPEQTTVRVERA